MNYQETLKTIQTDERFASYQNLDTDLLQNLEYYNELRKDVVSYCYSFTDNETELYYTEVIQYVTTKAMKELSIEILKSLS